MFLIYLKSALRGLLKNKRLTFIHIIGLSVGMSVAMLIALWVFDEYTYNRQFPNHNRIAQVYQNVTNNGEVQTWTNMPYPLSEELRSNYGADFNYVVMSTQQDDHLVTIGSEKLSAAGCFMETDGPDLFSLEMVHGNRNALTDPTSILLSESTAAAFFDGKDPLGQVVRIDEFPEVKVTGVYRDFPVNSSFNGLDFIAPWQFLFSNIDAFRGNADPWRPNFVNVFVEINGKASFAEVSARIKDAKLKKVNPQLAQKKPELFLQPMDRWHLYGEFNDGINTGGAIRYVFLFSIIGICVLLLACINFMNLSTARSETRAKEVGVRKTIGSKHSQLVLQFFTESFTTVFIAFLVTLALAQLSLPFFNGIANKDLHLPWGEPLFWLASFCFMILTGLVAGSYPSLYLAAINPLKAIKGTFKAGRMAALPRQALVVIQFAVSISFIIGTIVVYQQIQHAKNRPVGYDREGLIMVPRNNSTVHEHLQAVHDALIKTGAVVEMCESGSPATGVWSSTSGFSWPGKDPNLSIDFGNVNVSHDYGKTLKWNILQGRDFSQDYSTDSSAVILNQSAVEFMGLDDPVGQQVTWWDNKMRVIGVVENTITGSPYEEVRPVIYMLTGYAGNFAILRLSDQMGVQDALAKVEDVFKSFDPDQPFNYQFVNEAYSYKFGQEERIGKLSGFFAALAILISCLGLFGLSIFVAEQRTKEIGIRKVLGASVLGVWNLLSWNLVKLVLVSLIIAIPVSYQVMHSWLLNYTYRAQLSWWIFAIAAFGAMILTLAVVSYQTVAAARANPVKALKDE